MSTASESGEEIPRDPSAYSPSLHFAQDVLPDDRRQLDGDVIDACIEEGRVIEQPDGRVYYRKTIAGVTFRLVASPSVGHVITAYPIGVNPDHALETGRWSPAEVEAVREFLSEDSR